LKPVVEQNIQPRLKTGQKDLCAMSVSVNVIDNAMLEQLKREIVSVPARIVATVIALAIVKLWFKW
jgi:hypothetical protein